MKYEYFSQILKKCCKTDVGCPAAAAGRLKGDKYRCGLFLLG